MTKLFCICCIVILLFQVIAAFLKWLMKKLENSGHTALYILIGAVVTCGVLAVRLPAVREQLYPLLKPLMADLNFKPFVQLIEFLILTSLMRMMYEHFVLKLKYSRLDWILFILLGAGWTVLTFCFWM